MKENNIHININFITNNSNKKKDQMLSDKEMVKKLQLVNHGFSTKILQTNNKKIMSWINRLKKLEKEMVLRVPKDKNVTAEEL